MNIETQVGNDHGLVEVYAAYGSRVHQIDTWRHVQVVFIYAVVVPGVAFLSLAGDFANSSSRAWTIAIVASAFVSALAVVFAAWSQTRILVLAQALHRIESLPQFLPGFKDKSKLYWQHTKGRARYYLWITQIAVWLQVILLCVGIARFVDLAPSRMEWIIVSGAIGVVGCIEATVIRRLVVAELRKIESLPLATSGD